MKQENHSGISFFQRYLTVWVAACMALGVLIGKYLPGRIAAPAGMIGASNFFELAVAVAIPLLFWPSLELFKAENKDYCSK